MDNNQKALSHFGVPGMRWGQRQAASYDKKITRVKAKAQKMDAKGKTEKAKELRGNVKIYQKRKENSKEVAKLGEQIRKGSTFMDKLTGQDIDRMNVVLSKGKYTRGEILVSDIFGNSGETMNALINEKVING